MKATANIFTWMEISYSTPIRYHVDDGYIDFVLDTPAGGLELTFDHATLKRFLELASAALTHAATRPTFLGTAT